MNVFVLSTGRCGSKSFAEACQHLTNYTTGHETRAHLYGPERLAYPDNHIEVDNRLAWHLGPLGAAYDGRDVLYVHLKRDPQETAESLCAWSLPTEARPQANPASILRAWCHGITLRTTAMSADEYLQAARAYVDTVNANIRCFLRMRPSVEVQMASPLLRAILMQIRAEGDIDAAMATWGRKTNERPG